MVRIRHAAIAALIATVLLATAAGTSSATTYNDQPSDYSSSLVTHNGSSVYDWQLANMIDMWIADEGFANMAFIQTQCYSGGMLDELDEKLRGKGDVALTSSANHDETAYGDSNTDANAQSHWAREAADEMEKTGDDAPDMEELAENAEQNDESGPEGPYADAGKDVEQPNAKFLGNGEDIKLGKKTDGTEADSKHAIMFVGDAGKRHWNNLDRAHDALKKHGFTEGDMHVLADGGTGDPDAPGYVDGPGTKKALFDAIEDLRDEMNENEQFVFWSDDHGNRERTETALNKAINDTVKQIIPPRETAPAPDEDAWDLDEPFLDDVELDPDNTPYVSIVVEPDDPETFPDAADDYRIILNDEPLELETTAPIKSLDSDPDLDGYELVYPVENEDLLRPENTIQGEWVGEEAAFRPFTIDTLQISTGKIDEVPRVSGDLFTLLNGSVENYNANVDRVPGLIRSVVSNERINAEITRESGGTLEIGIETRDGRVTRFQRGHLQDPTLTASTDESTARDIAESGDTAGAAVKAVQSGEIDYDGVGAANSIKTGVTKVAIRVYTTIRGLVG